MGSLWKLRVLLIPLLLLTAMAWAGESDAAQPSLTWEDTSTNEDGFKIERKTGTSGIFAQIATVGANVTSYTDASLAAGSTYCYRVRAFNTTGDSAYSDESCGTISSDTQAPTVSLTAPANGSTVSGSSVTVSASASNNVEVVGIQFLLDSASVGSEDTTAPYSIAWDTTTATNGTHSLAAIARDAAGNQITSATVTVIVYNPPSIVITAPALGTIVSPSGMSNGFPILGAFGLVGTAAEGVALDPMVPSANPGQMITVTGEALSTSIFVVFSSTDTKGAPVTVETPLTNVNEDGTQASVTVPVTGETGPVGLRPAGGDPFPETALLQIVPTLSSLIVPAGGVLQPGVAATLVGTGFRVGATKVEFPGTAPVAPDSLTRQVLTVTVPAGLTAGSVRVRTDGGSSCWRSSAG